MRRLKRAAAAQRRINAAVERLVAEAVGDRENQTEIARILGKSREWVRQVAMKHRDSSDPRPPDPL